MRQCWLESERGMHARLHDALADGLRVAEAREVADGVEVHASTEILSGAKAPQSICDAGFTARAKARTLSKLKIAAVFHTASAD